MLFFKDSKIGQEPALFICKGKDDKDAKATTLIVRPPIIGRFSERWGHNSYHLNLPKWSQVASPNGGSNLETIISFLPHITKMLLNRSRTTLWDER